MKRRLLSDDEDPELTTSESRLSAPEGSIVSPNSPVHWVLNTQREIYVPLLHRCSANKLQHCISTTILWLFCPTKEEAWVTAVLQRSEEEHFSRETKPSPRSPFDQRHHLITCIPERAFIWNEGLIPLVCSEWIQRGTRKFCGGTLEDETDVNDEESRQ